MATAAELLNLQKAILRHVDPDSAKTQAAAGTTVAQYTQTLLKQAETSTLPALIVFEYVFGRTQSDASLDNPVGGAAFAAKQFAYYRDALKVANPVMGAYEAFGTALAGSAEFLALSNGRGTQQFISEQYDAIFGPAVASGTITSLIRSAGIVALVNQVEYFSDLYRGIRKPNGEFMGPVEALNQARAAVLGQILGIAATTPSLGLTLLDDAKGFLTAAVAGTAVFEESFETTLNGVVRVTVQQVLDGAANGKHYILADRLDKIVANPDVMKNADSYKLTNAIGGVGAVTVEGAKVLLGATNAKNFDYSLADTGPAVKAASANIIAEADTIAVIGSKQGETLDFSNFTKAVILNGNDGADVLRGTAFNDVYYGGGGTNSYYTNGGSDTLRLSDGAIDFIYLTASASGGFKSGPMHIYGFGKEDKFIVNNADFSANLEGSWTKDDYFESGPLVRSNNSGNLYYDFDSIEGKEHATGLFGMFSYGGTWPALDGSSFFALHSLFSGYVIAYGVEMSVKWKGFFFFDDGSQDKVFLYHADTGTDTVIAYSEMKLVAVIHDTKGLDTLTAFML